MRIVLYNNLKKAGLLQLMTSGEQLRNLHWQFSCVEKLTNLQDRQRFGLHVYNLPGNIAVDHLHRTGGNATGTSFARFN